MNMKRILSAVLTLAMILTMAAIPLTSMAADSLTNGSPKKVKLSTGDMSLLSSEFKPSKDAAGITVWLRVEGAKEPFTLGAANLTFETNELKGETIAARHHGQDGIREAMWAINANGDYLMWIPFRYYTLSHRFVGEHINKETGKTVPADFVTKIMSISYCADKVSAANKDATISCMGIFEGKVENFNTEFDVKGTKSTKSGTYQYMNAALSTFTTDGFTPNAIYNNGYYDRETNLIVEFADFINYNSSTMVKDENGKDVAATTKYKTIQEFMASPDCDPRAVNFTKEIEESWQYCYADSFAYPLDIALGDKEVFNGWKDANDNPMIPYGPNKLTADIKTEDSVTKHTVTFKNGDAVVATQKVADGGKAIYCGETIPTKADGEKERYVFAGWEAPEGENAMAVTKDLTLNAKFNAIPITFTVTYCDEDGTRLASETVVRTEDAKYADTPFKNGTTEKYYTFNKWVVSQEADAEAAVLTGITADMTVYASYTEAEESETYTITFVNYDDSTIKEIEQGKHSYVVYDGETPKKPLDQDHYYEFKGWDKDFKELRVDTTVKAEYNSFDVEKGHKKGADLNVTKRLGSEEIKLIDSTNAYSLTTPNSHVTLVFKATGVEKKATLGGFYMAASGMKNDGTEVAPNSTDNQGAFRDYKTAWELTEDGYYYLTIAPGMVNWQIEKGFNKITALSFNNPSQYAVPTANENDNLQLEFIALYEGKPEFALRFFNGEDFIDIGKVANVAGNGFAFGKLAGVTEDAYAGEEPTKAEDTYYRYNFDGWADKDGNTVNAVYDNLDLYAAYEKEIKDPITVIFMDRTEKLSEGQIPRGTAPVEPEEKPGIYSDEDNSYIFRGWTTDSTKQTQTGDIELADMTAAISADTTTFYAVYEQVDRMPEITFYAENKTDVLGKSLVYQSKLIPDAPEAPEKPATAEFTYTFEGWADKDGNLIADLAALTTDTSVYAKYTATANEFTVTFMDGDREMAKVTVTYGTAATAPSTEKTHKKPYLVYEFKGWDKEFSNVTEDMTVNASYELVFKNTFTDIEDDWYTKAVEWALINEHMSGDNKEYTLFAPHKSTSRAMLAQVLYNIEGRPDISDLDNPFKDVKAGEWYTDAVIWAYNNKVVFGVEKDEFAPDDDVTREQFAAFLYRYAKEVKEYDVSYSQRVTFSGFKDRNDISEFAQDALKYSLHIGCITGSKDNGVMLMRPGDGATRAEMASILKRFVEYDHQPAAK